MEWTAGGWTRASLVRYDNFPRSAIPYGRISLAGLQRLVEAALQRDLGWLQKDLRALARQFDEAPVTCPPGIARDTRALFRFEVKIKRTDRGSSLALESEPEVELSYLDDPSRVQSRDLLVLPGSKDTIADLLQKGSVVGR